MLFNCTKMLFVCIFCCFNCFSNNNWDISNIEILMSYDKENPDKGFWSRPLYIVQNSLFSEAYENGWDSRIVNENEAADVYMKLQDYHQNVLAIPSDYNKIPLVLLASEERSFTFQMTQKVAGKTYLIYDSKTNTYQDFTNEGKSLIVEKGTHENRYFLLISDSSFSSTLDEENLYMDTQFVSITNKEIRIHSNENIANVLVFDMKGELKLKSSNNYFSIEGLSKGSYFLVVQKLNGQTFKRTFIVQ